MYPKVVELAKDVPAGHLQGEIESLPHGFLDARSWTWRANTLDTVARMASWVLSVMSILRTLRNYSRMMRRQENDY